MLRNREFRRMLLLMALMTLAFSAGMLFFGAVPALISLLLGLLLTGVAAGYTAVRYRRMTGLSAYLKRICAGEYSLDVRDNAEGELSILKNEIHNVTVTLSAQAEQLRGDKAMLADALSDISHQLKTPLTSMFVLTELLGGELPEAKRKEFAGRLKAQLERIEWLVSSLLKISRLEAGTVSFSREKISLPRLIERAATPLRIPMELKEQTLFEEGDPEAAFTGDFNWCAEALLNILKNCVEHTGPGGEIRVFYETNPLYTLIRISDNGEGIAREDLPYIFKRFYRGKNASEDSVGIGLAMARSILQSLGGDIAVKSEKGCGTTFLIKIFASVV